MVTLHTVARSELAASAVEFALLAPLLIALVFGMLTGGLSLHRGLSIEHAAREAARYGATLPDSANWLADVADRAEGSATGEVDPTLTGHYVCVSLVASTTKTLERGLATKGKSPSTPCYGDGLTGDRVQVVLERPSDFYVFFFSRVLSLRSEAVARYELAP